MQLTFPLRPQKTRRKWRPRAKQWSPLSLFLVGMAGLMALLILIVPAYLLIRMVGVGENILDIFSQARTLQILGNTLLLAGSVTIATTLIAVPLAWLIECTDLPGRKIWRVLAPLPLVIPSYIAAFLYMSILTPKGLLQQLLAPLGVARTPDLTGFWGAFIVLTLFSYPYTFLTVRAALRRMDPALAEAARSLGLSAGEAFRRVTLPVLRPGIVAGGLLVSLYTLRDFGAVSLWQYSTFTRIIYNRYISYRLDVAAALAFTLVVLTTLILLLEQRTRGKARYARGSVGVARKMKLVVLGKWKMPALLFTFSIIFFSLIVPISGLLYWFGRGLQQDWVAKGINASQNNVESFVNLLDPAWHSLSASFLAALLAVLLALPIAILAVRRPGKLSAFFEKLTYASFALPGLVIALAFVFFGANYLLPLYQTLPMLLIAYVILFIPQAVGAQRTALLQIAPSLEEAGRSLGKSSLTVFRQITLPLVRPGLMSGGVLVFLTCMKELPATLLLSPLGFHTLSAEIWSNINEAFFARAALPTLLLLLLSSVPMAIITIREQKA